MRFLIFLTALISLATPAAASEQAHSPVGSFQSLCGKDAPDFARLDAKAKAMHLTLIKDLKTNPNASGSFARSESWELPGGKAGSRQLILSDAHSATGDTQSCGINAKDAGGNEVKAELVKALKLGAPTREKVTADGKKRVTAWHGPEGLNLVLMDNSPQKQAGAVITRMRTVAAK